MFHEDTKLGFRSDVSKNWMRFNSLQRRLQGVRKLLFCGRQWMGHRETLSRSSSPRGQDKCGDFDINDPSQIYF